MKISATILTKNSAKTILKTIESLSFLDEIIVLDNESTDHTIQLLQPFQNVKIFSSPFIGFGNLHNLATSKATNDWILSIDSDEVLSSELQKKLQTIPLDKSSVYSFAFQNILFGKKIRHSGWYPDRHIRLYNRLTTQFSSDQVHEKILIQGLKEVKLSEHIYHYSYLEVSDFLRKLQIYTDLFKEQNKGKPSSFSKAFFHGLFAWIKTYLLKLGFLDGKEGFIIASYQAQTAFYKYLKLWESNQKC